MPSHSTGLFPAPAMRTPISNKSIPTTGGRVFLGVFFSFFLAMGGGFFYAAFARPAQRILAARAWEPATCQMIASEVRRHADSEGDTYRIEVLYRYAANGRSFQGDRYKFTRFSSGGRAGKVRIVDSLPPGKEVTCWVNPADPSQSVIDRSFTGDLWFGLIPLVFMLIGAGGVYAAVIGRRTRLINAVPGLPDPVPHAVFATPEEARRNPLRLAPRQGRHVKVIGLAVFALIWNGMMAAILSQTIDAWRIGAFAWLSALFLTPFLLVGIGLVVGVAWQAMQLASPRPLLTVGSSVVALGEEIKVHWLIQGNVERLARFTIDLEGIEEARYRRGTDTTTDRLVFTRLNLTDTLAPVAAEGSRKIRIPRDSMHSFSATNNKIIWSLRVKGEIPDWPDSDDVFPLTVAPARP